jgi:anthranilate synthase component 1
MGDGFVNMVRPGRDEFIAYAEKANIIPVYREILADRDTPVTAHMKLGETPSFLLESVEGGEKWARYSFVGFGPSKIIEGRGRTLTVTERGSSRTLEVADPLAFLKEQMAHYNPMRIAGLPRFFGGLVGYLGYDMVRFIEDIPDTKPDPIGMPDLYMMLTDTMLVFDSLTQKIKVVSSVHIEDGNAAHAYDEAVRKIEDVIARLRRPLENTDMERARREGGREFFSLFGPREEFEAAVERAKEYVRSGDVVQVVLSQRFERESAVRPFNVYRALRTINPSPYMFYLNLGDAAIVGSSPEILVRLEGREMTVRPIAGTRARGGAEDEDRRLAEELKADPKEIAEHIMLVDLGRNDVGRVAKTGTVRVTDLMTVERYSHVMHMVSNVVGELRDGLDAFDVMRASFPAGTVSGAPKVRAMEIIEELEPLRRGAYAGAVGYFSYNGNMDTCITIRTILMKDGKAYIQAGAGIVADSVPSTEYQETLNKAAGMMRAVDMAEEWLG